MKTGPDATAEKTTVEETVVDDESIDGSLEQIEPEVIEEPSAFSDVPTETVVISEQRTKVGFLLPLSGRHKAVGQALMNAAQLALFDVSGEKFDLVVRDTAGTPTGATAAMESLLSEKVDLVVGPLFATSVSAITPLARSAGINVLSFSNDQAVAGDGIYVLGLTPEEQIRRVVDYSAAQGIRKIAEIGRAHV